MVQADMLAYHDPKEPPQLGLPDLYDFPEFTLQIGLKIVHVELVHLLLHS